MAPRIYVGRFDPQFLGVSIRASNPSDVYSFRLHDRSGVAPVAVLDELGDDAMISDLSRQTVLDHELRHFRDSLLFPFGARIISSRLHASYNGFQVAMSLKRLGGDASALPVPLQQWLRMPAAERDAFIVGETAFAGTRLRPPPLPVIPADDDVSEFAAGGMSLDKEDQIRLVGCRLALADYRMGESLWRSPHAEGEKMVSPAVDIWEAAGLICQLAAIERYAGEPLMQRFIRWMEQRGPNTYRRGLAVLTWCLGKLGWPPTLRNHLTLTTWAQMGAYATEMSESSPAHRLATLVSATAHGSRWSSDSAFTDLVRDWDAVAGADSFAALRAATVRFGEFCGRTVRTQGMPSLPAELFTSLANARERMLAAFLADPDSYVDPVAYLAQETRYPLPCVGLEYSSGALGSDWTDVTPVDWSPVVSFDNTLSLVGLSLLSDAVFLPGEKSLQRNGRHAILQALDLRALRIIR